MSMRGIVGVVVVLVAVVVAIGVVVGWLGPGSTSHVAVSGSRSHVMAEEAEPSEPSSISFRERARDAGLTVPHFDAADGRFRL
ncbi:MAG: hypothetical protein AB7I30_21755, partial [Isosphaeraceae bacterium]